MTATVRDVATLAPLGHAEAMDLQRHELEVTVALLQTFDETDWASPTDCPAWDVRHLYLHVLGACEAAGVREMVHQLRAAAKRRRRNGGPLEAALSAVQVEERCELTPPQLVERLAATAPRTIARRRRLPAVVRSLARMKVDGPVEETWRLGYLVDTIYLRDLWMHRIDACRATGHPLVLDAAHDGRIVEDVVAEWARRHGQPFRLNLTGPAGGVFDAGSHSEELTFDAVEFCRTLAGRERGNGLMTTVVPF